MRFRFSVILPSAALLGYFSVDLIAWLAQNINWKVFLAIVVVLLAFAGHLADRKDRE